MEKVANVLSLGMGVQSTALYLMSSLGELPRIDYAVFSDPGAELTKTMEYLEWLLTWADKNKGPKIIVKSEKNLYRDLLNATNSDGRRFASIPAFTSSETGEQGMLRRQCTGEYKIEVVDQAIREVNGLKKRQRNIETNIWKGISIEESDRMSNPEAKWKNFIYPYIGYAVPGRGKWYKLPPNATKRMDRGNIITWYRERNLPIPPKSRCKFCPYQSDSNWSDMKVNDPADFADAVKIDKAIRNSSQKGITQPIFLHRSLQPLETVVFDKNSKIEFVDCSGNCGV